MKKDFEEGVFDCSEDEMNNFWIDLYIQERDFNLKKQEDISAVAGETVTIILTKENHL